MTLSFCTSIVSPSCVLLALTCFGSATLTGVRAAEPSLTHMHPAAIQAGMEADVKLTGKFDPWPCRVWTAVPGIEFTPGKDAGVFHVKVAAEVPAGPHLIRAYNSEGASAPISMAVASSPQTMDTEPNDDYRSPQLLTEANVSVNGRHEKGGDVDSFAVTLTGGQTMVAWVEAYVLAAGFDAMLRVVDEGGQTLAFNHDGTTMDPFLVFTAPKDGRYIVQTMGHKYPASTDVNFAAGEDCVYRLHLSTRPFVRNIWPLAVERGKRTPVLLEGWNLASPQVEIDGAAPPGVPVSFSEVPEIIETTEPQTLAVPSAVSGRIEAAGGEDHYQFSAAKDSRLELSVAAPRFGSAMDAWIRVRDKDGKELSVSDDDGGSTEPRLVWTAPAEGLYTAAVGELTQRAGKEYFYRLLIAPAVPELRATTASHAVKVEAGKSVEVKVTIARINGFQPKLKLAAGNLPAGITAGEVEVPENGGDVAISLAAAAGAAAASQPFQLVLRETEGGREHPVLYSMVSSEENNGVPQGYRKLLINNTSQLWLTVTPPPAPPPPAAAPANP